MIMNLKITPELIMYAVKNNDSTMVMILTTAMELSNNQHDAARLEKVRVTVCVLSYYHAIRIKVTTKMIANILKDIDEIIFLDIHEAIDKYVEPKHETWLDKFLARLAGE